MKKNTITLPFLQHDCIIEMNRILGLPEIVLEALKRAADYICGNERLRQHASLCYDRLLQLMNDVGDRNELISLLTSVEQKMEEQAGMFAAVMIVSTIPHVQQRYTGMGIPLSILMDTFSDIHVWMKVYHSKQGRWGLGELGWILNHVECRIFKIGRLQYMYKPHWGMKAWVYRNKRDGSLQKLANVIGANRSAGSARPAGSADANGTFCSTESSIDAEIAGNPISGTGETMPHVVRLRSEDWELVLSEKTPVLDVHIQEGGKLSPDICKESMDEAVRFFHTYFPEKEFAAFVCSSWLLGPSMLQVLPAESNVVQFQKLFELVHSFVDDEEIFRRVFGEKPADLQSAPRTSSLQRAVLDYAINGNHFDQGVGFIYRGDK